jgi:hypothetical protein
MPKYITHAPNFFDSFINFIETLTTDKTICLGFQVPPGFDGIAYNTEQLTAPVNLERWLKALSLANAEVWDYSMPNIRIMAKHGIIAKYVPLVSSGSYLERLRSYLTFPKEYDIGFSGSVSARRELVLQQLRDAGFSIMEVNSWGVARDIALASCKVHINIHYSSDYMIFESARCEPWLSVGMPVISELSIENDERCILTTYDGFLKTVKSYFANKNQSLTIV